MRADAMSGPTDYEFCCRTRTLAGHSQLERLPEVLGSLNASTPFVISDGPVRDAGVTGLVYRLIMDLQVNDAPNDETRSDAHLDQIRHLAQAYRETGSDALIAVGGGSVINTAKILNILVSTEAEDIFEFARPGGFRKALKPLIAIPTTSGSGVEVTTLAELRDSENGVGFRLNSPFLIPDAVLLDSRMTLTLPPEITIASAANALTLAVEAHTAVSRSPLCDAMAMKAIGLIGSRLVHTIEHPGDKEARLSLAVGANLAGIAGANTQRGMARSLAALLSTMCGIRPGAGMAALLPYALECNLNQGQDAISPLLLPLAGMEAYAKTPRHLRARKVVATLRQLNERLFEATDGKHGCRLKDFVNDHGQQAVSREALPVIAKKAMLNSVSFHLAAEMKEGNVLWMLERAWEGAGYEEIKEGMH